jgi:hypothetical protein
MRAVDFTAIWLAETLLLLSPVLLIVVLSHVRWVRPGAVAVAGAVLGVAPFVVRVGAGGGWDLVLANARGLLAEPALLAADWLPFLVSGAVLDYTLASDRTRRNLSG